MVQLSPGLADVRATAQPGLSRRAQGADQLLPPAPTSGVRRRGGRSSSFSSTSSGGGASDAADPCISSLVKAAIDKTSSVAADGEAEAERKKLEKLDKLKDISQRISKVMKDCKGGSAEKRTAPAFFWAPEPTGSRMPNPCAPAKDAKHYVTGGKMHPPWPEGFEEAMFGMGCFWCSENLYMKMTGVYSTQVGYAGGTTPNPSYSEVCTGMTKHNEVVRVVFDPKTVSFTELLKVFWERHDPTTLNRQGGDSGTQYRSGIYYYSQSQREAAEETKELFQKQLPRAICTEIVPAPNFFYAEDRHQQYDAKPDSQPYCGLKPTGAKLDISGDRKSERRKLSVQFDV